MAFSPAGHSTPVRRALKGPALSALITPDISNVSALEVLSTLDPPDVDLIDAIVARTPSTTGQIATLLQAYHEIMRERGHDAAHDVLQYQRLLKLGVVKGSTFRQKWDVVKARFGYGAGPSTNTNVSDDGDVFIASPSTATTRTLAPSFRATTKHKSSRDSTAPSRPSRDSRRVDEDALTLHSHEDGALSDTVSHAESFASSYPRRPTTGRTAPNLLGLQALPAPSILSVPREPIQLSSEPPTSRHRTSSIGKLNVSSRREPAIGSSIPTRVPPGNRIQRPSQPLPKPPRPKVNVVNNEEAWEKIRIERLENEADQFREDRLVERCWGNWRQSLQWIFTTHQQVVDARNTVHLHVALQRWHERASARLQFYARVSTVVDNRLLLRFFAAWKLRTKHRRIAAWREDMRAKMKTVRARREGKLMKDAWARWRQLYQSRLAMQHYVHALKARYFGRWQHRLVRIDDSYGLVEGIERVRDDKALGRCWENWRRALELRRAERAVIAIVSSRLAADALVMWKRRTANYHRAESFAEDANIRRRWERWKYALQHLRNLEITADLQFQRAENARLHSAMRKWLTRHYELLLEQRNQLRLHKRSWLLWKHRVSEHQAMNDRAIAFYARPRVSATEHILLKWVAVRTKRQDDLARADLFSAKKLVGRLLLTWRWKLRINLKLAQQAKLFRRVFLVQHAFQVWKTRARDAKLERIAKIFHERRLARVYNAWVQKAAKQRYFRTAEGEMRGRIEWRVLREVLSHWTSSVIQIKLRELDMAERHEMAIVARAYSHWKAICVRHVEELSLMQSYQDVKREELLRSTFHRWLSAARAARHRRKILDENERSVRQSVLARAWQAWRDQFQDQHLRPLENRFSKQLEKHTLFRAFASWQNRTASFPAIRFHSLHLKARMWEEWRGAMPKALQARQARQFDHRSLLTKTMKKWVEAYQTKVDLKAAARARYLRVSPGPSRLATRSPWPNRALQSGKPVFPIVNNVPGASRAKNAADTLNALTARLSVSPTRSDTLQPSSDTGAGDVRTSESSPTRGTRRSRAERPERSKSADGEAESAEAARTRLWAELRNAGVGSRPPGMRLPR